MKDGIGEGYTRADYQSVANQFFSRQHTKQIPAKNSLALARQGYDLMDKKRNILVREMMDLVDQASTIQTEIDTTFRAAYEALQHAHR